MSALLSCVVVGIKVEVSKKPPQLAYPDVFILGAQKCATTVLNKMLMMHSQFCHTGVKEKHYFTDSAWVSKEMTDQYLGEFADCGRGEITLDSTPSYVADDGVPDRIAQAYPPEVLAKKKFVVIFRDPAARHYSQYQRDVRRCLMLNSERGSHKGFARKAEPLCQHVLRDPPTERGEIFNYLEQVFASKANLQSQLRSFAEWTAGDFGQKALRRGYYLQQLENWLQVIERRQLFIISFESLIKNTTDVVLRLSSFLNVDGNEFFRVSGDNSTFNGTASAVVNGTSSRIRLPPEPPTNHYMDYDKCRMDCPTYVHLESLWNTSNHGLVAFINGAKDKPPSEPFFPPFTSSRAKCYPGVWVQEPQHLRGWFNVSTHKPQGP